MKNQKSELLRIPGIGPSMSQALQDLGFHTISDLRGADPEVMYTELGEQRPGYLDRCVLYGFRCAVYFASHDRHDPKKLKWWNWKDDRKKRPSQ